ncbi:MULTISPECIES: glycosyltransferase family 39 protein [Acidobacteriaceae]|uniref:ArnT family glycosyltransferase n=1 Tax=Acidobacteriaceae TaxID=204434 RepID=UPI00131D3100|nr:MULTISPECIES: glycosyltransferase family 39 protein [Acidobacteriaceae]MDW5266364.1 glycosyltransferase family 39 protein [Edaphobacter sp.]
MARSIAQGHGFSSPFYPSTGPTAIVPPLFTYLLAAVFRTFGLYTAASAVVILSINSVLSALTCVPLYFSTRYALGQRAAMLTAWGWALYPFAIYFSATRVWEYALTGFLFTTCFCLAQRLHRRRRNLGWIGFGILYGITGLSNPSVLPMFPVFLILTAIVLHRRKEKWLVHSLIAAISLLVVLAPWTIRNYRAVHLIAPVRDNFWLEFWPGNNGNTFESNDHTDRPPTEAVELQKFVALGETAYLAQNRVLAMSFVRQHPFLFIKFTLHRVLSYWTGYWSFNPAYLRDQPTELPNMFFTVGLTFFMLLGARSLWRRDKTTALPYLLLLAIFPIAYYLTHVIPDYRQPIEPEIIALVSAGVLSVKRFNRPLPQPEPELVALELPA